MFRIIFGTILLIVWDIVTVFILFKVFDILPNWGAILFTIVYGSAIIFFNFITIRWYINKIKTKIKK